MIFKNSVMSVVLLQSTNGLEQAVSEMYFFIWNNIALQLYPLNQNLHFIGIGMHTKIKKIEIQSIEPHKVIRYRRTPPLIY